MAYYDALIAKWATLSGTTAQKLAAVNAATVAAPADPAIIPSYAIYNALDPAEFVGLTAAQQQRVRDLFGMGTVDVSSGTNARAMLVSIFGAGTATRAALVAVVQSYENKTQPWWQASIADGGGALGSPVSVDDLIAAGGLS